MEHLFYCRDRPGTWDLRMSLGEDHWAFMDKYAEGMIARGPTFAPDGDTVTGSLHIVDLPDAEAVRAFAYDEPNHRAGVYEDEVLIRRWRNVLGRTMWQYAGERPGYERFLILAHGSAPGVPQALEDAQRGYFTAEYAERLIAYGPLFSEDGTAWRGTALLAELPDRDAAGAMMAGDPCAELYGEVEIHTWTFGGRR
ncbi:YciI family protein [Streptomyces sp. NPDC048172]|uniref:YciI family protein n=1 Tax=Streptomyces sp. NPDC048172 TaxID=3365505 RepID=UPI00371E2882